MRPGSVTILPRQENQPLTFIIVETRSERLPVRQSYAKFRFEGGWEKDWEAKIPVLGVPGLSLSYNGCRCVHGSPVNLTDPSGQIIPIAAIILGAAAGAAAERLVRSAKGVGRWLRGVDDDVARATREAGGGGRVRAARPAGAEASVDLTQRRTWYDVNSLEFSDDVVESLHRVFHKYPVDSGECRQCAREVEKILTDAGYNTRILQIDDAHGAPILLLNDPMPNGETMIALGGQGHRVVEITAGEQAWYIDALVHYKVGVNPVSIELYRSWWQYAADLKFTPYTRG